jgi:hypothetical protein
MKTKKTNFAKVLEDYNTEKTKNPESKTIFMLKNRKTGVFYLSLFWSRTFIETLKAPEEKENYYEIYL